MTARSARLSPTWRRPRCPMRPPDPAAPTNLTATAAASPASVSLSWTDNATNATSYTVERSDGTTGDWTVIASGLSGTATSYVDTSVTAGASYSYEVEAFDGTAGSPFSNVASATVPYAIPAAPTNLTATASASPASVSLSWTDNAANATSYTVERSDGTTGDWTVIASGLAGTATSWVDSNVTAGATYSYEVEAFDGTAGSPFSNVASATVPYATPAAPTNLTATAAASPASVSLSWTDNATNATSYTVERSSGTTGVWTVIASGLPATATSYVDTNVTAGATYSYEVEAFDGTAGVAELERSVGHGAYPAPAAPTNLSATVAASPASVSLSWTDNASQRDFLHGRAVQRHDGCLDRHRQRPSGDGHELRGHERDGRGDLQLSGRGVRRHGWRRPTRTWRRPRCLPTRRRRLIFRPRPPLRRRQ